MMPDLLRVVPLKLHVRSAAQPDGAAPMYELFCRWRNETLKPDDSFTYTEWSVWRTYEAFQALDTELRAQKHCKFAKMMVTVAFAPEHRVRMFFHQDQTARFLEKRQKELDYYMQRILLFSGVSEFVAGTGSRVLATFLDADQHVDCSRLFALDRASVSSALSPTSLLLEQHSREALRTLNVDMHAAFSPASSYASSSATSRSFDHKRSSSTSGSGANTSGSTRKAVKQEIEDEVASRGGEHALKRFRKRARAFRKENDPSVAAQGFVAYVAHEFDSDFSSWLLQKFIVTVKQAEKTAALRAAGRAALLSLLDDDADDDDDDAASRKARRAKLQMQRAGHGNVNPAGATTKLSRKQSSKEIMARVHKSARGNDEHIESFKVAAKALGSQEMTTAQFVAFVRATFGRHDAHEILLLVADVVPLPHVQRELRDVLAI